MGTPVGLIWSIKKDKREQPLSPFAFCTQEAAEAVPGGESRGDVWGGPIWLMPQSDREAVKQDLVKEKQKFAHMNTARTHLSPTICRCSPMNIFILVNFAFYIPIQSLSWSRSRNMSSDESPRAGSSPAPTPVTGRVTVSIFYIIPLASGVPGSRGRQCRGQEASWEWCGSCGAALPRGQQHRLGSKGGVAIGIFSVKQWAA